MLNIISYSISVRSATTVFSNHVHIRYYATLLRMHRKIAQSRIHRESKRSTRATKAAFYLALAALLKSFHSCCLPDAKQERSDVHERCAAQENANRLNRLGSRLAKIGRESRKLFYFIANHITL